jgi:hypothetical protein
MKFLFFEKKNNRFMFFFLGIIFFYLDAFTIFNIPVPWIGFVLCVLSCISTQIMPYRKLFWMMIVLIFILIIATYTGYEENRASLSFILIRFLNIIGLIIVVNYFASQDYDFIKNSNFENNLVYLGLFFSLAAIIPFILEIFNISEINFVNFLKNRVTTGGGELYPSNFNSDFDHQLYYHRTTGTFREPSLLVIALILPLFLSLKNRKYISTIVISICIYFTYSLAMIIAISFGLIFSLIIIYKLKFFSKNFILSFLLVSFITFLFYKFGLFDTNIYLKRISHLLEDKSRNYIYKNLDIILGNYWTGNGIGYGFFELSQHIFGNRDVPTSFLSLPLNFWSAGGIISLIIILIWIFYHNIVLIRFNKFNRSLFIYTSMLNVFLLLYFTSFEEMHIWHATGFGVFLSYINNNKFKVK